MSISIGENLGLYMVEFLSLLRGHGIEDKIGRNRAKGPISVTKIMEKLAKHGKNNHA
jgi:hypothetical protein